MPFGQLIHIEDGPKSLVKFWLTFDYLFQNWKNHSSKFGQNCVSNSWDIANIEFLWLAVVGDGGVHSHFHVKLNLGYVCLSCGWVGVLKICLFF